MRFALCLQARFERRTVLLKRLRLWVMGFLAALAALIGWQYASAAADLAWTAPTTNTDGSALTDLAGYRVYRRSSETTGTYAFLASTPNTSFTDNTTTEGSNCYVVTALDASGNESDFSNQACKFIDTLRPNTPTGLTVN